jgi:predicted lipase
VVAFRGTLPESFSNWILDLDASKFADYDSIPNAQVHSGFLDAYNSVSGPLKTAFNQLMQQYPGSNVLFTGHSMGAAMANLAATDMLAVGGNGGQAMLITFGCPRVGNQAYASFAENNFALSWRITHAADIVPHVPPMWMVCDQLIFVVFVCLFVCISFPYRRTGLLAHRLRGVVSRRPEPVHRVHRWRGPARQRGPHLLGLA